VSTAVVAIADGSVNWLTLAIANQLKDLRLARLLLHHFCASCLSPSN